MSERYPSIQLRLARRDELDTILKWLDDPTLLAVTNSKQMTSETRPIIKEIVKSKIVDKSLWIVVRDNFRIGSIFYDSHFSSTKTAKHLTVQHSKSIFVYTKARLDWALLSSTFSEIWRKQIFDSAYPVSILKLPLSDVDSVSNHDLIDDIIQESPKTGDNSGASYWGPVKKIRILGPKSRNESIRKKLCGQGFEVIVSPDPYDSDSVDDFAPDMILSSGYDRLLRPKTVQKFPQRIVNLHAAYLPWGRGIGTTLFATLLRYPHGVSVHFIDKSLDTGRLVA